MSITREVAKRSTCDRLNVGAVLVVNKRIVSTGYNGSISGQSHCDEVGHLMIDGGCRRTIHAEANAISQAAKFGIPILGSTLYVTHTPCIQCYKMILNSGVVRVVYGEDYKTEKTRVFIKQVFGEKCDILERLEE